MDARHGAQLMATLYVGSAMSAISPSALCMCSLSDKYVGIKLTILTSHLAPSNKYDGRYIYVNRRFDGP